MLNDHGPCASDVACAFSFQWKKMSKKAAIGFTFYCLLPVISWWRLRNVHYTLGTLVYFVTHLYSKPIHYFLSSIDVWIGKVREVKCLAYFYKMREQKQRDLKTGLLNQELHSCHTKPLNQFQKISATSSQPLIYEICPFRTLLYIF